MTIRSMQPSDLGFCLAMVDNEGWLSETREVFEDSLAYDASGCLIAEDDGQSIGMIVVTAYNHTGFMGELIVRPEVRGRGHGGRLMREGIAYLKSRDCRSIYLDGDTPAVPLYERLGFTTICKSLRFVGRVKGGEIAGVRRMTSDDLDTITSLDRELFGADRSFFLDRRLRNQPSLCHTLRRDDQIVGFAMGRPGHGVVTVGPWIAPTADRAALNLLRAIARESGGLPLRIGALESNPAAADLLRSAEEFTEGEPSWRMVLGPDIGLGQNDRILAIGSPAKG